MLDGKERKLEKYDVLYNFENEPHWFFTNEKSCDFVEFFVPGQNKTIWTKTTNVCTWSPIGVDINGQSHLDTSKNMYMVKEKISKK